MRFDWLWAQSDKIFNLFLWHSYLAIVPVVIGLILAIPVGWGIHHLPSVKSAIVNLFGLLYTIPSLALFVLLPPLLHTQILDPINVVVALAIGSFALLVCTVCDGLDSVSADTRQSAAALGYKPAQQFFQNDPPLAVPVIRYGLCVAVVFKVRIVSVAALIGTPQLGSLFTLGLPAAISDSHHRWDRGQHHSGAAAGYAGGLRHSSTQPLATSERIIMLTWFMDPIHWFGEGGIFPLLAQHISYSAVALAIAFIIAFPVGCYTGHTGKGEGLLIGTTNALRSLPSFGLIILLVILLSGEFESDMAFILPCILVLVALALPPIALGVHAGIRALDPYVLDAARGMGMTRLQILLQVELPCALPLILSGVRSATLQIISTATIAAYVSLGGFGRLIIDGRAANDFSQMIAGAMLVALLALLIDCLFSFSQKIVVSPGITRRIKNP